MKEQLVRLVSHKTGNKYILALIGHSACRCMNLPMVFKKGLKSAEYGVVLTRPLDSLVTARFGRCAGRQESGCETKSHQQS